MYIKSLSIIANPHEIQRQIAERVRSLRLSKNIAQDAFAKKAGISYSTYRKFESTGEISLFSFIKIANALDASEELNNLFSEQTFATMDELLASKKIQTRRRARSHEK